MTFRDLPALNAALNCASAILLAVGYALIRRGHRTAHQRVMLAAVACSLAFLTSYLVYHWRMGTTRFPGSGTARAIYFSILGSHTLLAATVPVLVAITLTFALRGRFDRHRRIARWTLPVWLYVSVTGVAVYWLLYRVSW